MTAGSGDHKGPPHPHRVFLFHAVAPIANVQYAEETIVDLMGTAGSARTMLLWFRTLLPWITIGIGAVLVISSAAIVAVTRVRLREVEA